MKKISTVLMFGLSAVLSGCMTAPAPIPQSVMSAPTALQMNSVNVIDNNILEVKKTLTGKRYNYGKIAVESTEAGRTETGNLSLYTSIQNLTDYPQSIQVRSRFYDVNRQPIEGFSAWQRLNIAPRSVETYSTSSLSNAASYYYVEIKEGI